MWILVYMEIYSSYVYLFSKRQTHADFIYKIRVLCSCARCFDSFWTRSSCNDALFVKFGELFSQVYKKYICDDYKLLLFFTIFLETMIFCYLQWNILIYIFFSPILFEVYKLGSSFWVFWLTHLKKKYFSAIMPTML